MDKIVFPLFHGNREHYILTKKSKKLFILLTLNANTNASKNKQIILDT